MHCELNERIGRMHHDYVSEGEPASQVDYWVVERQKFAIPLAPMTHADAFQGRSILLHEFLVLPLVNLLVHVDYAHGRENHCKTQKEDRADI